MKTRAKDRVVYLGFFLFAVSVLVEPSSADTAIILLLASFGTFIFGSLIKS